LASSLHNLSNVLWSQNLTEEPRALARQALEISERHYGNEDARLLPLLETVASHNLIRGSMSGAFTCYERIYRIKEIHLGSHHFEVGWAAHQVAKAAWLDSRLDTAWDFLDLTFDVYDANDIAEGFYDANDIADGFYYASSLNLRGILKMEEGRYVAAQEDLDEALEIRRRVAGTPNAADSIPEANEVTVNSEVGQSLNNIAELLDLLGDLVGAQSLFETAIGIYTEQRGAFDPDVAFAKTNLGKVLLQLGDFERAEAQFRQALEILDRTVPNHDYKSLALTGYGRALLEAGRTGEARKVLRQARSLMLGRYQREHPRMWEVRSLLARTDEAEGKNERARRSLEALELDQSEHRGSEAPALVDTLLDLSRLSAKSGRLEDALEQALRAANIALGHLRLTARGLPERQALRYAASTKSSVDATVGLATYSPAAARWEDVLDTIIRSRAVVLDEMALRSRIFNASDDPEITSIAEQLKKITGRLDYLYRAGTSEEKERREPLMREVVREKETLEEELARANIEFRRQQQLSSVGVAGVRDALAEDAALVSYYQYGAGDPAYGAFVLRAGESPPSFFALGSSREIDKAIERWREEVAKPPPLSRGAAAEAEAEYRKAAKALRKVLWDPFLPVLSGARHVYVVPDGAIHWVNFATLPEGDRYLLESDLAIYYLSAERELSEGTHEAAQGESLLALGGPDYDAMPVATTAQQGTSGTKGRNAYRGPVSDCPDFGALQFEALPLAAEEAREVAFLWESGTLRTRSARLLTGAEAGETAFKVEAPRHHLVHLATHGFFFDAGCIGRGDAREYRGVGENPLLRSGLAFGGANRRTDLLRSPESDDGILTAEEVASLDLSGVEWVVLSACNTGLGEVQAGEGVLGLRRAFRIAGAGTLIMSLWPVRDDVTRVWMNDLYDARGRGLMATEAVREASRVTIEYRRADERDTHPFYWGAFVAVSR
jgi:CHAT domain-containing protein